MLRRRSAAFCRNITPLILLFALCASDSGVQAATFFVSTTGSDSAAGTSTNGPFRTITRAARAARPGDSIEIRSGTYREEVDLSASRGGAPARPLTISSYKGEPVLIKGTDLVTGWALDHGSIWKTSWTTNSQELLADGKALQQIGFQNPFQVKQNNFDGSATPDYTLPPVGSGLSDVTPGSFYYDAAAHVLYCDLPDSSDPNSHTMEASVRSTVILATGMSYVNLHGLSLIGCNGTVTGDRAALLTTDGSHWNIADCTFEYGDFAGLTLSGTNILVRDCRVTNNGDVGVNIAGSDAAHKWDVWPGSPPMHVVLQNLTITGNNFRNFDKWWHSGGIKAIASCRDVTVRGCTVVGNGGPGIWFDSDYGGIVIENNLVSKNNLGIVYEISYPTGPDSFGAIIRNNRVIGNYGVGIYVSASQDATVENNTCYHNWYDIGVHGMPRTDPWFHVMLKNNSVLNNILDGSTGDVVLFDGAEASNNRFDGNFYTTGSGSSHIRFALTQTPDYTISITTLAGAQAAGYEQHGLTGDPRWADPMAMNFALKPGSQAAGKGWQPSSK